MEVVLDKFGVPRCFSEHLVFFPGLVEQVEELPARRSLKEKEGATLSSRFFWSG